MIAMAQRVMRLVDRAGTEIAHRIEIAVDFIDLFVGLLGRANLPAGEGLYLTGCWNIHMFFMRFPIDVIYVDDRHRVLETRPGLRPWRTSSCRGAYSTIELGPGTLDRHEIQIGDRLRLVPLETQGLQ